MAQIKYRVHEVGKDFNVKSNDIIDLLTKYFGEEKNNHMKVLSDEELNVIFEHYTQQPGYGTLEEYFNTYEEKPKVSVQQKKEKTKPETSAEKSVNKAANVSEAEKPEQSRKVYEKNSEKAVQVQPKPESKPSEESKGFAPKNGYQNKNKPKPQKQKFQTAVIKPKAAPAEGVTILESPADTGTLGSSVKVVDTRTPINVNLAKYDERLNDIVGERANKAYRWKSMRGISGNSGQDSWMILLTFCLRRQFRPGMRWNGISTTMNR